MVCRYNYKELKLFSISRNVNCKHKTTRQVGATNAGEKILTAHVLGCCQIFLLNNSLLHEISKDPDDLKYTFLTIFLYGCLVRCARKDVTWQTDAGDEFDDVEAARSGKSRYFRQNFSLHLQILGSRNMTPRKRHWGHLRAENEDTQKSGFFDTWLVGVPFCLFWIICVSFFEHVMVIIIFKFSYFAGNRTRAKMLCMRIHWKLNKKWSNVQETKWVIFQSCFFRRSTRWSSKNSVPTTFKRLVLELLGF